MPVSTRIPGLDGLRALAVCAVLAFHFGVPGVGGGMLGVDIFFALSGFLITTLLLAERAETGGVSLGRFWQRRARRLLPALILTLAGTAVLSHWVALVPA
ncbi:MAG: acyltransferase family protein, partial [Acidimicrobiales bacterium]